MVNYALPDEYPYTDYPDTSRPLRSADYNALLESVADLGASGGRVAALEHPLRSAPIRAIIPDPTQAFPSPAAQGPILGSFNSTLVLGTTTEHAVTVDNINSAAAWHGPIAVRLTSGRVESYDPDGGDGDGSAITWEFCSDAPRLSLRGVFHSAHPYWLEVDGELVTTSPQAAPGNPHLTVRWADDSRKVRHYRFLAGSGFAVAGIVAGVADSVWAPPAEASPLVGWLGDSFSGGAPTTGETPLMISHVVSRLLGWRLRKSAIGGTGYAVGSSTFLTRVPRFDDLPLSGMVFAGGLNDSTSGLQAAAEAVFDRFRDAHPSTPMVVLGPWSPSSTFESANAARWTALEAACDAYDGMFIDTRGWVTGTGNVGATEDDGNADVVISADGTHPSDDYGHPYLGTRLAQAIAAALAAL